MIFPSWSSIYIMLHLHYNITYTYSPDPQPVDILPVFTMFFHLSPRFLASSQQYPWFGDDSFLPREEKLKRFMGYFQENVAQHRS